MKHVYSKYAGETLRERLRELAEQSPAERASLESEIDVTRLTAVEALRLWELACVDEAEFTTPLAKVEATQLVRDSMDAVAKIVERAARVRVMSKATADLETIDFVVRQVERIIAARVLPLAGGEHAVKLIGKDIKEIALPRDDGGATATAAQVREAMRAIEASVPAEGAE